VAQASMVAMDPGFRRGDEDGGIETVAGWNGVNPSHAGAI